MPSSKLAAIVSHGHFSSPTPSMSHGGIFNKTHLLSLQSLAASRRSLCCPSRSEVVTTVHILIPARYCTCGGMDRQRRGADGGIFRPHPYLVPPAKGRQGRIGHRAAHRPCAPSHSFNTTLAPTPPPLSLRKVSRRPQSSPNPGSDCARSDHRV